MALGVICGGGKFGFAGVGLVGVETTCFFEGDFGGLPPEVLSKILRGSLRGFLRRCTIFPPYTSNRR